MNPFFLVLFAAASYAAPSNLAAGIIPGAIAAPRYAGYADLQAAPGYAGYADLHAAPAVVPAPIVRSSQGPGVTTVHQAPAQVRKQVHLGQTTYVSNVHKEIIKPPTPYFPIEVPTVLKGTTQVNPAIVKTLKQTQVVNQHIPVERKVPVPYDVPVYEERIREIPNPVAVPRPVPYAVPTPVQGEPIVQYRETAPVVQHRHTAIAASPVAVAHAAIAPAAISYANQFGAPLKAY